MRAAGGPDLHTRLVGMAKVILPLAALAILSSLFLFARVIDPEAAIPYADVDVERYARDPRLTAPTYAGTTGDGTAITVRAAEARPTAGGATAQAVELTLQPQGGAPTRMTAGTAALGDGRVTLGGGVRIASPSGLVIETPNLSAALDRTEASTGPVTATGPLGELSAGALRLDNRADAQVLHFTGGVRVVYVPQQPQAPVP